MDRNKMKQEYLAFLKKRYDCKLWFFFQSERGRLIYGKGIQARYVYEVFRVAGIHIEAFVSTKEEIFAEATENEKNFTIDNLPESYAEADILVAVNPVWNDEITNALHGRGFKNVITIQDWEPINKLFQTHLFRYMVLEGRNNEQSIQGGIIRFCDGPEEKIKLGEYSRQKLLDKICDERLDNVLFHVYDEDNTWMGMLQLGDLLVCDEDWTKNIDDKKIYFDETVFERCNTYFEEYPWRTFAPVYRESSTAVCMAWLERPKAKGVFNSAMLTLNSLAAMTKAEAKFFFSDISEVCLHGVNELSYKLYSILKEKEISCYIEGKNWELLGEDLYREEIGKANSSAKDCSRVVVYAENQNGYLFDKDDESFYNRKQIFVNYIWLCTLAKRAYTRMAGLMIQTLKAHGIAASLIIFPELEHIRLTQEESFDCQNDIYLPVISREGKALKDACARIYKSETIEKYLDNRQCEGRFSRTRQNLLEWSVVETENRKRIYLIGPCVVWQTELPTEFTLVAQIQRRVDEGWPGTYAVCGIVISMDNQYQYIERVISCMDFNDGDICLFLGMNGGYRSPDTISLTAFYNGRKERWFSNSPIHLNEAGSEKLADYIFEKCVKKNLKPEAWKTVMMYASELDINEQDGVNKYAGRYRDDIKMGKCGCIVMNCNPYTKGHDYLVRTASEQVDWLYIFVVEEDKSLFSFADRIELVRKNTEKYHNVVVLPSGEMILSVKTLPTYFTKETQQDIEVDATKDLRLFGLGIAPAFGITVRFAGEEPNDRVTAQYNKEMRTRLSHYGIDFVEIPRKRLGGGNSGAVISASTVRELLAQHEMEKIKEYVPECTWEYLNIYSQLS